VITPNASIQDKYIDRDAERDDILRRINEADKSSIHIVYAATAIGKSTLSSKILDSVDIPNIVKIRLTTPPENSGSHHQEWLVFNDLFETVIRVSEDIQNTILSFRDYLQNDEIVRSKVLDGLLGGDSSNSSATRLLFFKSWLSKMLSRNEYNPTSIILDDSIRSQMIKKAYLNYAFQRQRFLVIIDNLQNVDNSSLRALIEILRNSTTKKHFILFEYTLTQDTEKMNLERTVEFIRASSQELNIESTLLQPLPRNYVVDVVNHSNVNKPNSFSFNMDLLKFYDEQAKGNLKQVVEFAANYEKTRQNAEHNRLSDETLESILSVGNEKALYILSLVIHYKGVLSIRTLNKLEGYFSDHYDYAVLFEILINARLIKADTTAELRLDHASIIDSWKNAKNPLLESIDTVVCSVLEQYYQEAVSAGIQEVGELPWLALTELYKVRYPEKIPSMMEHLRVGVLKNVSPQTAWDFLSAFINATQDNLPAYLSTYYEILNICFEFELYDEGYRCVQIMERFLIYPEQYRLLFHKMMYLSALDRHEENIALYNQYAASFPDGSRERLNMFIIAQASYRALNDLEMCRAIHDDIIRDKRYRIYDEYGYFLRIANMYLPKHKAVHYLRKSYYFFLKRELPLQAGKSAISYAHIVSSLGHLRYGQFLIGQAEELLHGVVMGSHMILLNKAVIKLHRGEYNSSVWNYLELAEKSTCVPFDQLAVQIGKLVWCLQNRKYELCSPIVNAISHLAEREPDKHIVALAYYDLFLYYTAILQPENARYYKERAYKLRQWAPTIRARMEKKFSWDNRFLLKKPWSVAFLEYWTYDLLY